MRKFIVTVLLLAIALSGLSATEAERPATRRFGIFIGSNHGGRDRVTLRYAVSDARALSRIFGSMGGITDEDNILLIEPTMQDINRQLDNFGRLSAQSRRNAQRTELVFYYSGHSNEDGILLNRQRYGYRELRQRINAVQTDMRIVILDSCSSGAMTRVKGGVKTQPFLFDSSVSAEGYAILTSSSADEASQESDTIESSYFTHSLMAGLRGAADSVGDGRVTLNELYRYAYTETLAKTETSLYGVQHPSYDIQISGSGDVVLTDVKEISAGLVIPENLIGRISIRDGSDFLVAEVTKVTNRPLELGLEPGLYRITFQQGDTFYRTEVALSENQRRTIAMVDFQILASAPTSRIRGVEDSPQEKSLYTFFVNSVSEPFPYPLVGFINIAKGNHSTGQLGFVNWNTGNFSGVQASFVNTTWGNFDGMQAAFVNTTVGTMKGVQLGFVNTVVKDMTGPQLGFVNTTIQEIDGPQIGFVNVAMRGIKGFQLGFVNYADSIEDGVPIGFISIVRHGGYHAVEYSFSEFHPVTAAVKIGVEKFYTSLSIGYNPAEEFTHGGFVTGFGFGSVLPIGRVFFFNPELSFSSANSFGDDDEPYLGINFLSFVPSFGINIGRHFSITAGPSVTWANAHIYNPDDWPRAVDTNVAMPKPLFGYNHSITPNHSIVIGARAALRVRF